MSTVDEDALQSAGDYRLREIIIKSSQNVELDFRDLVMELNIYESIYSNSMYGTVVIRDSANHVEHLPIIGQEEINFLLETPGFYDQINFREFRGRIYKIDKQTRSLEREQTYLLHFTTRESIDNSRIRISNAFNDTTSNIATKILKTKLKTEKRIYVDNTSAVHKIVSPNMRPFDLITMLSKRSESSTYNTSGYLFFENHRGYHFRSYESLSYRFFEPRVPRYAYFDRVMKRDSNNIRQIELDLSTLQEYKILRTNDLLANYATGMLSSTHYTHDIHTKTWTKTEYNYFDEFEKTKHVDEKEDTKQNFGPFYSKTPTTLDGKKISEYTQSKIYVSPRDTKLHSKNSSSDISYDNRSNIWLQTMRSKQLAYDNLKISIKVYGNTYIAAGDLIYVSLPSLQPIDKRDDILEHQLYSGRYIVANIRHIVNNLRHEMIIECVKDNFFTKLSELEVSSNFQEDNQSRSLRESVDVNSEEEL